MMCFSGNTSWRTTHMRHLMNEPITEKRPDTVIRRPRSAQFYPVRLNSFIR